jgi:hypothetical protein
MEFLNNGDIRHARYSNDKTIEWNVKLSLLSKHILIILSSTLHSIRLANEIILPLTKLTRLSEKYSLLIKIESVSQYFNPSLSLYSSRLSSVSLFAKSKITDGRCRSVSYFSLSCSSYSLNKRLRALSEN